MGPAYRVKDQEGMHFVGVSGKTSRQVLQSGLFWVQKETMLDTLLSLFFPTESRHVIFTLGMDKILELVAENHLE